MYINWYVDRELGFVYLKNMTEIKLRITFWIFVYLLLDNYIDVFWLLVRDNDFMKSTFWCTIFNNTVAVLLFVMFYFVDIGLITGKRLHGRIKSTINTERYKGALISFLKNNIYTWLIIFSITCIKYGSVHGNFSIVGMNESDMMVHAPGVFRFGLEFLFVLVCVDFCMYWMHRIYHWGPLYKFVHSVHHENHDPVALNLMSVHFIELFTMTPVVPVVSVLLHNLVGLHPLTVYCIPIFTTVHGVLEHCGYDDFVGYLTFDVIPCSKMHFVHHQVSRKNYAFYFYFWDWVFNTKLSYEDTSIQQKIDVSNYVR